MGLDRDKWLSQLEPIMNKYNNTEHRTIHMTPNQAKKEGNKLMVSFNLWNNAKKIDNILSYKFEMKLEL